MEMVLDIYKRPFDPTHPVVCMDESPKQLIGETETPIPASPGQLARYDYEYRRFGMCNVFLACEPLAGKRMVKITERISVRILQDRFMKHSHQKRQNHYGRDSNSFTHQSMEAG